MIFFRYDNTFILKLFRESNEPNFHKFMDNFTMDLYKYEFLIMSEDAVT